MEKSEEWKKMEEWEKIWKIDELSRKILPKNFPYGVSFVDEKAYKKPIFSYYKGPVYWMDHYREIGMVS